MNQKQQQKRWLAVRITDNLGEWWFIRHSTMANNTEPSENLNPVDRKIINTPKSQYESSPRKNWDVKKPFTGLFPAIGLNTQHCADPRGSSTVRKLRQSAFRTKTFQKMGLLPYWSHWSFTSPTKIWKNRWGGEIIGCAHVTSWCKSFDFFIKKHKNHAPQFCVDLKTVRGPKTIIFQNIKIF